MSRSEILQQAFQPQQAERCNRRGVLDLAFSDHSLNLRQREFLCHEVLLLVLPLAFASVQARSEKYVIALVGVAIGVKQMPSIRHVGGVETGFFSQFATRHVQRVGSWCLLPRTLR